MLLRQSSFHTHPHTIPHHAHRIATKQAFLITPNRHSSVDETRHGSRRVQLNCLSMRWRRRGTLQSPSCRPLLSSSTTTTTSPNTFLPLHTSPLPSIPPLLSSQFLPAHLFLLHPQSAQRARRPAPDPTFRSGHNAPWVAAVTTKPQSRHASFSFFTHPPSSRFGVEEHSF